MGRASDRTMLRSVVRVQSLTRGNLSFLLFFFFLLSLIVVFLAANNNSLMSLNGDTQTSSNLYLGFVQDVKLRWYIGTKNAFIIIKRGKETVDRNSKSKWKEVFSYLLSQLQIYNKRRLFLSYGIVHLFLGLIFVVLHGEKFPAAQWVEHLTVSCCSPFWV